jgi:hypothetical protein
MWWTVVNAVLMIDALLGGPWGGPNPFAIQNNTRNPTPYYHHGTVHVGRR